ncbi:MAG: hypothetical protein EXQ67_07215 [Thermoleophilia bacterium]|nr:hypothetical protein [Thermoleophilia bacterium]
MRGSAVAGRHAVPGGFALLAFGALGIIYGDIGTSPLYALQAAFNDVFGLSTQREEVLGLLSLFIWTLVLVTIKYTLVVMRADNEGEGGTLALGQDGPGLSCSKDPKAERERSRQPTHRPRGRTARQTT